MLASTQPTTNGEKTSEPVQTAETIKPTSALPSTSFFAGLKYNEHVQRDGKGVVQPLYFGAVFGKDYTPVGCLAPDEVTTAAHLREGVPLFPVLHHCSLETFEAQFKQWCLFLKVYKRF